jgi:hypothetical protein
MLNILGMKKMLFMVTGVLFLFIGLFCTSSSSGNKYEVAHSLALPAVKSGNHAVAVLEMFTSQGCSSCPPADRLLGVYASREDIVALSYHVDYWDHLGWKDPFSSGEFTSRQRHYASLLHSDIYTPQLIINGSSEMVGSDENKISATIKKALEAEPGAVITIRHASLQGGHIAVAFEISGSPSNAVLNFALVEKKTVTPVKAGENGGATLTNYNVVRNLLTRESLPREDTTATLDMPAGAKAENISVIIFLQDKTNNRIFSASQSGIK